VRKALGALGPHGVPGLPAVPSVNAAPVELYVWTPGTLTDAVTDGVLSAQTYLLAWSDPGTGARAHSGGHLLRVRVPAGAAAVLDRSRRRRPRELTYGTEADTFVLPVAWLGGAQVVGAYALDGAGGVVGRVPLLPAPLRQVSPVGGRPPV